MVWAAALVAVGLVIAAANALASEGDLDASFSADGKLLINADQGHVFGVTVDAKGRTVLAGSVDPAGADPSDVAVERLLPDGSLDPSFSGDGLATIDASGSGGYDSANAVAIDAKGNIVLAGQSSAVTDSVVVRLTDAGAPDPSFGGGDGVFRQDLGGGTDDVLTGLTIDSSGRPVAVGAIGAPGSRDFLLLRLTTTGTLDTSFAGGTGFDSLNVNSVSSNDFARAVALDSTGRILVGGDTQLTGGDENFAAARFTADGMLDTTFSNDLPTPGRIIELMASQNGIDDSDFAHDIVVLPGDKLALAGSAQIAGAGFEFAVLKLTSAGVPDTGFSSDGKAYVGFGGTSDDFGEAMTVDSAGKLVLAGSSEPAGGTSNVFAVARLLKGGGLDTSFSGDGITTTSLGGDDTPYDVAIDPVTQRIVAGGDDVTPGASNFAVARYEGVPRCAGLVPTIVGTNKDDEIHGTKKADVIAGGGGGDTIKAAQGKDVVCGGDGKDRIVGGSGGDTLYGNDGNDNLLAGPGKDKVFGGKGKDKLKGGPGKDKLKGGPGHDFIIK